MFKKLLGQTAIYGLSSMVGRLLNYLLVPLHTRMLNPEQFGVNTDFYAWASFLMIVYTYGFETALFRFGSDETKRNTVLGTGFTSILGSSFLLSGLLIVFSVPISEAFGYNNHAEIVVYLALILGLDAMASLPFGKLRLENKAIPFVTLKLVNIALVVSLNLLFFTQFTWFQSHFPRLFQSGWMVSAIFLANLIANGISFILIILIYPIKGIKLDFGLWKQMMTYSLPLLFAGLAGMVNETLDRILLKAWLPMPKAEALAQTGIYGAVYKLAILMTLFTQTFRMAAEPFFFQHATQGKNQLIFARVTHWFVAASGFIVLLVLLFLDFFKHFLGEAYWVGLPVVPILLFANLFLGAYFNFSIWFKIADKTKFGLYFTLLGAFITIITNYITIPIMGIYGAAYTTLLCYFVMAVSCYWIGQRYYTIAYNPWLLLGTVGLTVLIWKVHDFIVFYTFANDLTFLINLKLSLLIAYSFIAYKFLRKTDRKFILV